MARKKKAKVTAKNVDHQQGIGNVETEVMLNAPDEEAEPAPAPAIVVEPMMKVVDKGITRHYTKSEYDKKYGKKAK